METDGYDETIMFFVFLPFGCGTLKRNFSGFKNIYDIFSYISRFNLNSPYVVYHVATLVCQSVLACLSTYYFFVSDLDLHNLSKL